MDKYKFKVAYDDNHKDVVDKISHVLFLHGLTINEVGKDGDDDEVEYEIVPVKKIKKVYQNTNKPYEYYNPNKPVDPYDEDFDNDDSYTFGL